MRHSWPAGGGASLAIVSWAARLGKERDYASNVNSTWPITSGSCSSFTDVPRCSRRPVHSARERTWLPRLAATDDFDLVQRRHRGSIELAFELCEVDPD